MSVATLTDQILEVERYFGPVLPDSPWPMFLAKAERAQRFAKREELSMFVAVRRAIGAALGGEDSGALADALERELTEAAYPVRYRRQQFIREAPDG